MKTTVVIPAFQAARWIADAVQSVLAEGVDEVIVSDDGSTDDTLARVPSSPQVRVLTSAHRGIGHARNAGVKAATGDLLGFCDADDLWGEGRLAAQRALLEASPDAIVMGEVEEFVCPLATHLDPTLSQRLVPRPRGPQPLVGAMLLTRDTFARVGPFPEDLPIGEAIAWFARQRALNVPLVAWGGLALFRRLHGHNTSLSPERRADYAKLARHLLLIKRADGSP